MKFLAVLFLAIAVSSSLLTNASAATDTQSVAQTLFALVNAERRAAGIPALTVNPLLVQAGGQKASDMMAKSYFNHTSPEGKEFFRWIDEMGYGYIIAGENLASNVYTISPEKMVSSWMNSPTHRANILSEKYMETGIGVISGTYEGKETVMAVQLFASPRVPLPPVPAALPQAVEPAPVEASSLASIRQPVRVAKPEVEKGGIVMSTTLLAAESIAPPEPVEVRSEPPATMWTTFVQKVQRGVQLIYALFR